MCFIHNYRVDVWLFWFRLFQNGVGEEDEARSIGDGLLPLPKGLKPLINYRIPNPHQLFNRCSAMSQEPANPTNQVEHSQDALWSNILDKCYSGPSQKFIDFESYLYLFFRVRACRGDLLSSRGTGPKAVGSLPSPTTVPLTLHCREGIQPLSQMITTP